LVESACFAFWLINVCRTVHRMQVAMVDSGIGVTDSFVQRPLTSDHRLDNQAHDKQRQAGLAAECSHPVEKGTYHRCPA
jgi:hypothetical protein